MKGGQTNRKPKVPAGGSQKARSWWGLRGDMQNPRKEGATVCGGAPEGMSNWPELSQKKKTGGGEGKITGGGEKKTRHRQQLESSGEWGDSMKKGKKERASQYGGSERHDSFRQGRGKKGVGKARRSRGSCMSYLTGGPQQEKSSKRGFLTPKKHRSTRDSPPF